MKTITLTQSDYTNITKAFFFYLENEKELNLTKKDIDSILKKDTQIESKRIGSNNGTHEVIYESFSDLIKISHTAKNRDSFALGSIVCAQWIINQNGFFEMDDFLNDFL